LLRRGGKLVELGRDDDDRDLGSRDGRLPIQEVDELLVVGLDAAAHVHEEDDGPQGGPRQEIRLDELAPGGLFALRALGVAIAGKVDEVGLEAVGKLGEEEVYLPRGAWRAA